MGIKRLFIAFIAFILCGFFLTYGKNSTIIVADSLTGDPLPSASIFNNKGWFIGISKTNGSVNCASPLDFPITIRYLGYFEKIVPNAGVDTVFMEENVSELSEVVIETRKHKVLHMLAYVREYSTLSTYTDTITMFREKMVDYMIPDDNNSRFKGWRTPRTLNCRSYYQFTNVAGLDSVSDRCNHHFTWSDWIGVNAPFDMPSSLCQLVQGSDTVKGRYRPSEIWNKKEDRVSIDINVLSDSTARKWVPGISSFLNREDIDFEQIRLHLNFDNVLTNEITPLNLTGYSFNIDSRGRGRDMFYFNRPEQPCFVSSYVEVYIIDKEFITVKEARKWENRKFDTEEIVIFEPSEAPELSSSTLALIERVNNIDRDQVRLYAELGYGLMVRNVSKNNFHMGYRALSMLKDLTGISQIRHKRKTESNWRDFTRRQKTLNNSLQEPPSDTNQTQD